MVWKGGMPLGLFKGERTFTVTPGPDGSVTFSMAELYSGLLEPLIGRTIPDLQPATGRVCRRSQEKSGEPGVESYRPQPAIDPRAGATARASKGSSLSERSLRPPRRMATSSRTAGCPQAPETGPRTPRRPTTARGLRSQSIVSVRRTRRSSGAQPEFPPLEEIQRAKHRRGTGFHPDSQIGQH